MPWLTIIMTVLSFLMSKKSGASDTKALTTAALVGGATYYTTHETEWGKTNLGKYDGVVVPGPATAPQLPEGVTRDGVDSNGAAVKPVVNVGGTPINTSPGNTSVGGSTAGSSFWDLFKSDGVAGTVGTIGFAAVASKALSNPWILLIGGVIAYKVITG